MRFIEPATPQTRPSLPKGDAWLFEPKVDGWRLQAHKAGRDVVLYSKRGLDLTRRFPTIAAAVLTLPAASAILDCEVVALGGDGHPHYLTLHRGTHAELRLYAFDLMHLDGLDVREEPLTNRKHLLQSQLTLHGHPMVRPVATFVDGAALLAECERRRLEGVVAKRRDAPYRSDARCGLDLPGFSGERIALPVTVSGAPPRRLSG